MAYVVIAVFILLLGRYFWVQAFRAEDLQQKVVVQRVKKLVEQPERGRIVDKNGDVLAFSLMSKNIAVYPNLLKTKKSKETVAKLLSKELDLPYKEVWAKVNAKDSKGNPLMWQSIKRRVDVDVAKRIQDKHYGAIEIVNEPKRYYPNGKTGASILGMVNQNGEANAGLEIALDSYLKGVPGYRVAETDSKGKVIPIGYENVSTPLNGQTVTLTTDTYLQQVVEDALVKTQKDLNATKVHAVLMNPKDGSILAMASTPSFDPNNYSKYPVSSWSLNPATYVYEPGSTFKPVYMAMAMDAGHITKDFTYNDGGSISVNGTSIRNWDGINHGPSNLRDVILRSSNVGMINISRTMTSKQIVSGLKKAGIGQTTGVELTGEERGLFPTPKQLDDDPIRKATVSFGQGISVTPLQLVSAFSQVINGGYKIQPHLVDNIKDQFGNITYQTEEPKNQRVYKKSTSDTIKGYLNANMHEGSGKTAQIDGYEAGGKTGSAWFVENGRYVRGEIIGSFMGFAPLDNPQVSLLVVVEKPDAEFGSTAAGPAWQEIMTETLRYLSLKKQKESQKAKETVKVPDVRWMLVDDAKDVLADKAKDVNVKVEGKGNVVTDRYYRYDKNELTVTLVTKKLQDKTGYYIPSLTGKTKDEINKLFKGTNVSVVEHGVGTLTQQVTAPGYYKKLNDFVLWYQ